MNQNLKEFSELTLKVEKYLLEEVKYSQKFVAYCKSYWRRLSLKLCEDGFEKSYNPEIGDQFVMTHFVDPQNKNDRDRNNLLTKSIGYLNQYFYKSEITINRKFRGTKYNFAGPIGTHIHSYLETKQKGVSLASTTMRQYKGFLNSFLEFCNKKKIPSIQKIDTSLLNKYLKECNDHAIGSRISCLRGFLKYCFNEGLFKNDISKRLPRVKSTNRLKLPTTYDEVNIKKLLKSIDRSTHLGKRDYAIILLFVRYGIRASDVAKIKFENIKWSENRIELFQSKTGAPLVFPLFPDVGNSIIEYLKYGRPESDVQKIFLIGRPPYCAFENGNAVSIDILKNFQ